MQAVKQEAVRHETLYKIGGIYEIRRHYHTRKSGLYA